MNALYKILFPFAWIIVLSGCTRQSVPAGRAIVTGQFINPLLDEQNAVITLSVPGLLLANQAEYKKTVESNGSFTIDIPMVSPMYATVSVDLKEYTGRILLSPGKTTHLDLFLDEAGNIGLCIREGVEITRKDLENIENVNNEVMMAVLDRQGVSNLQLPVTPEKFAESMLIQMEKDLAIIYADSILSEDHKKWLYNLQKLFYLIWLFEYEDNIHRLYHNQQNEREEKIETFVPQKADKSYYAFLQHFDLNNPPQFDNPYYVKALQYILTQPALDIPRIGDSPIADWLKETKAILSGLTGIKSGLFYDILTAEAYINQFWDELNPLSERQKENILAYFSNPSFAESLFAENERTIRRLQEIEKNIQTNLVVNETPSAAKGELLDAIISKYKGKVVLVDFWATWCGSCMEALGEFRLIKDEFLNKNIVFVYITNISSPKKLWERKISEIGHEHYYLEREEWMNISYSNKYGFRGGIPTYFLFNSNGELKQKFSGYPGNKKMQAMIEELLP